MCSRLWEQQKADLKVWCCRLTKLAAGAPERLGVEIRGVHPVGGRVDSGQLALVELDEGRSFLLHQLMGFGLAQRRHLPAAVSCHTKQTSDSQRTVQLTWVM